MNTIMDTLSCVHEVNLLNFIELKSDICNQLQGTYLDDHFFKNYRKWELNMVEMKIYAPHPQRESLTFPIIYSTILRKVYNPNYSNVNNAILF